MKNRWKKKKMKVSRVLDIKIENFQAQKLKIKLRKSFLFKFSNEELSDKVFSVNKLSKAQKDKIKKRMKRCNPSKNYLENENKVAPI